MDVCVCVRFVSVYVGRTALEGYGRKKERVSPERLLAY